MQTSEILQDFLYKDGIFLKTILLGAIHEGSMGYRYIGEGFNESLIVLLPEKDAHTFVEN